MRLGGVAERLVEMATAALVLLIAAVLLLQVVGRHVLAYPFSWPEEVAGFLFVWLIFLGSVVAYRRRSLIGIEWLPGLLPPLGREAMRLVSNLIVVAFLVTLIWQGIEATIAAAATRTTVLRFSWLWVYLALPVGFGGLLIAFLIAIFNDLRSWPQRLRDRRDAHRLGESGL